MKILGKRIGKREGWDCDPADETGTRICRRFAVDKQGRKLATGTEVGVGADPSTCEPVFSGNISIMDDDDGEIERIAKKAVSQCRREKGF